MTHVRDVERAIYPGKDDGLFFCDVQLERFAEIGDGAVELLAFDRRVQRAVQGAHHLSVPCGQGDVPLTQSLESRWIKYLLFDGDMRDQIAGQLP